MQCSSVRAVTCKSLLPASHTVRQFQRRVAALCRWQCTTCAWVSPMARDLAFWAPMGLARPPRELAVCQPCLLHI